MFLHTKRSYGVAEFRCCKDRGTIAGTVIGAILFSALKVGLITSGVDTFWQYVATGVVIIIAAYVEIIQGKLAKKK